MLYRGTICKDAIYVPLFKSIGTNHISCHLLVNDPVVGDDGKVLLVLRNVGDAEAYSRQHLHRHFNFFNPRGRECRFYGITDRSNRAVTP